MRQYIPEESSCLWLTPDGDCGPARNSSGLPPVKCIPMGCMDFESRNSQADVAKEEFSPPPPTPNSELLI
jgi:hypothetical protein